MKVAIQGIVGCFHHEAAELLYGSGIQIVECNTFKDVFSTVERGGADRGVVAIENSLQGSINPVYRLLARSDLRIEKEIYLKIEQCLIAIKEGQPSEWDNGATEIISMAPALAQVEQWLDVRLPKAQRVEYHDTAASVKLICEAKDPTKLAVAGRRAAEMYGGCVIAAPINDDPGNYTRFFSLTKAERVDAQADKTSLIVVTDHTPGALYRALGAFNDEGVNITKLASYPIPGDQWHYAFYLDYQDRADSESSQRILDAIVKQGCTVTILGSYKAGSL